MKEPIEILQDTREKPTHRPRERTLGWINIKRYLDKTDGQIVGKLLTDAKARTYSAGYQYEENSDGMIVIRRDDGHGDCVALRERIPIDTELIAFFGLYSGDGAKGSEDPRNLGVIKASISFSQREPNLVRFAVDQFRRLFSGRLRLTFSLGEDSAHFMAGDGLRSLKEHYGGELPHPQEFMDVRPSLNAGDRRYLAERRNVPGTNEENLAFYYQHKDIMQQILVEVKTQDVAKAGITLNSEDRITASLRRPYKKGAREPGGSSRSDELHIGGLSGFGEFFLKMMYELESSIYHDTRTSPQGLVGWTDIPSELGEEIDIRDFFSSHPYGTIAGERPMFSVSDPQVRGRWPRSIEVKLKSKLKIGPLFAYSSGLYFAEGGTPKPEIFAMHSRRPRRLSLAFTSSEETSLTIMFRFLSQLFPEQDIMRAWKIKVGSQYFPELVSIGLKHGVPMLRGGASGDGKMRTMEISEALKPWALEVCPSLQLYSDRYSHVEPTG
ncbi:MAG: hypothetical protein LN417_04290, partial [Candidatus Thermoplasmatota archaeon]|nr:hypothetical protein [Candidatus Thermoplasmatota archaeon]